MAATADDSRVPDYPADHALRGEAKTFLSGRDNRVYQDSWESEKKKTVEDQWIFVKERFSGDLEEFTRETGFKVAIAPAKMFGKASVFYTATLRSWSYEEYPTEMHFSMDGFATMKFPKLIGFIVAFFQFMCESPLGADMHLFDKWKDAKFHYIVSLDGDDFKCKFHFLMNGHTIAINLPSTMWEIGAQKESGYYDVAFKQGAIFEYLVTKFRHLDTELARNIGLLAKEAPDMIVASKDFSSF